MPRFTKKAVLSLIHSIFDHSEQAVLIVEHAAITYANASAEEMLKMSPVGKPLIDFVDFGFASACFDPDMGFSSQHNSIRFGEAFFRVVVVPYDDTVVLFLYYPNSIHTAKAHLRDTAYSLLALYENAKTGLFHTQIDAKRAEAPYLQESLAKIGVQLKQICLTANEALEGCDPMLYPYDLCALFDHVLFSFSSIAERGCLTVRFETGTKPLFVPMNTKLLHAALVGMIFDLLRMVYGKDTLTVTLSEDNENAYLRFDSQTVSFPDDVYTLLFSQDCSDQIKIMQEFGTQLFRASRIFMLHNGSLTFDSSRTSGFSLTVRLPLVEHPPMLYAPFLPPSAFPVEILLSPDYIHNFFLSDSEEP